MQYRLRDAVQVEGVQYRLRDAVQVEGVQYRLRDAEQNVPQLVLQLSARTAHPQPVLHTLSQ